MSKIKEAVRQTEVLKSVDVIVVGAGVSGIAAALSAARLGMDTILIERSGKIGGILTDTLMTNICNYFVDKKGNVTNTSIAKQIVDECAKRNGVAQQWLGNTTPGVILDPEIFEVVVIDMLEQAKVNILTHCLAVDIVKEDDLIKGIIIESNWGRQAVMTKAVIDCSGEAVIANLADVPMKFDDKLNTASMLFRMGNVDIDAFVEHVVNNDYFDDKTDYAVSVDVFYDNWKNKGFMFFPHSGGQRLNVIQDAIKAGHYKKTFGRAKELDKFGMYALRGRPVTINSNMFPVTPDIMNIIDFSSLELEAKKACRYAADFLAGFVPGFEKSYMIDSANSLGIRRSRYIKSDYSFTPDDLMQGRKFNDTIGVTTRSRKIPHTFIEVFEGYGDIPLRSLIPYGVKNLIIGSGKSIDTEPAGLLRSMARCMTLGQGAGAAAAVAIEQGTDIRSADIKKMQKNLFEQGVYFGDEDRIKELGLI